MIKNQELLFVYIYNVFCHLLYRTFFSASKELVSWMRGHDSAVHSISVDDSGRFAITTSTDNAQLWDLDTFERKRKLNVKSDIPIQEVIIKLS